MRRLLLASALLLASCAQSTTTTPPPPKTSLQITAIALLDTAQTVGSLETAVINANQQKLIDDATTAKILTICSRIAIAGKQADAITAGISTLSAANKASLLAIFTPILAAVNDALSNGVVTIKDPATLSTVKLALSVIAGALSSVQAALQGAN
jgi:hypothetical protein